MSPTPEAQIEDDLITKLGDLKYTYRPDIRTRQALEDNFRAHFNALNHVTVTDSEWERLQEHIITADTFKAAGILRAKHTMLRDDGTPLDFTLVNTRDWCKNTFEVVRQLRMSTHDSSHRYDVLLLLNGVPVVQIELKRELNSPRLALEQIVTYKHDKGNGYTNSLLCFVQLFVVSNRTKTFYFANNGPEHFSFHADERYLPVYRWAGPDNRPITHLDRFADTFLAKCTLAEMISRYMVLLETERKLLMMRPYQIYAVKNIVQCIHQSTGNGYIWHTTGSGKTLTSFKASTLLRDNPDIDKCIFVVDRKDLDRQTREEFNRFQAGAVEQNSNTGALVRRLASTDVANKVIVTTIQKLVLALDSKYESQLAPLRQGRVVFIFDECHRSQFGENHQAIKAAFPNSQLFGFTGTPIFPTNSRHIQIEGKQASRKTTADLFQQELHAYTISHAIEDGNVLKFRVDYFGTGEGERVKNTEPNKRAVVETILAKHDAVTAGRKFNAIFATASIDSAAEYYDLFKQVQAERQAAHPADSEQPYRPLNIACVFSPPPYLNATARDMNEDLAQESADYREQPEAKKQKLEHIIHDYNAQYSTNHTISEFDAYYQDVQGRMKDQQYPNRDVPHAEKIDIVIVVDMLLTGFDSKYLNTLYLDKKLVYHGLIQAMSRTNRILNDTKPYGNILDFRGQQEAVDEAIRLFSSKDEEAPQHIWLVEEAGVVVEKLQQAAKRAAGILEDQGLAFEPSNVEAIGGDYARFEFLKRYKEVQRLLNSLSQYTDLTEEQRATVQNIIPNPDAFKGAYLELAHQLKAGKDKPQPTPETEDLDLELVLFATAMIDYDYIMTLLARSSASDTPEKQHMTREKLLAQIAADAKFVDEKNDISEYIRGLPVGRGQSVEQIKAGYEAFKAGKTAAELQALASKHGLDAGALQAFVSTTLTRMIFDSSAFAKLLIPLGLGWKDRKRKEKEIMSELAPTLQRLAGEREISGMGVYEQ